MSHCAIQIRDAIVALVTGLTTTGTRVFKSPIYPLAANALPGIVVMLGPETLRSIELPRIYERKRSIDVIPCAQDNADLDGALAQSGVEIEGVLGMADGPWKTLVLTSIDPNLDTSGAEPVGQLRMRYEAMYYTRDGSPSTFE